MRIDIYSLAKAGLSEGEIQTIANNKDENEQIQMLRKYRFRLLEDIHSKQQSLDTIDYIISRMKKHAQDEGVDFDTFSSWEEVTFPLSE